MLPSYMVASSHMARIPRYKANVGMDNAMYLMSDWLYQLTVRKNIPLLASIISTASLVNVMSTALNQNVIAKFYVLKKLNINIYVVAHMNIASVQEICMRMSIIYPR